MSSSEHGDKNLVAPKERPKKKQKTGPNKLEDEAGSGVALPVAAFDASFTETSIPESGEQYLALVQLERNRLPGTVTAEEIREQSLDVEALLSLRKSTPLVIKKSRIDVIVESFEADRRDAKILEGAASNLPSDGDRHAWLNCFYGVDHSKPEKPAIQPDYDKILSSISREMAMQLLSFHNAWLEEVGPKLVVFDAIYKLLVIVDDKPSPSQTDKLRSLARHCMKLLESGTIPEMNREMEEIVVIVAARFGQRDLVRVTTK